MDRDLPTLVGVLGLVVSRELGGWLGGRSAFVICGSSCASSMGRGILSERLLNFLSKSFEVDLRRTMTLLCLAHLLSKQGIRTVACFNHATVRNKISSKTRIKSVETEHATAQIILQIKLFKAVMHFAQQVAVRIRGSEV